MRRRILGAIIGSTLVALLGFGIPLAITIQRQYRDDALLRLSAAAAEAAVAVPGNFQRDNDTPELPALIDDIDVALYDTDNTRLLGIGPDRADDPVNITLDTGTAHQDRDRLVVAFPVSDEEIVIGAIRASTPSSVVDTRVWRTWGAMAALASAVFAASTLLALRRSRTLARPLAQLGTDATTLGDGGHLPPRDDTGITEIDSVRHALVDAARRLNQLLTRERAFSADLAHQLRTPIASLRLRLETEQTNPDHDHDLIEATIHDLDRLEATIDDLVALARDIPPTSPPRPLATLVKNAVAPWTETLTGDGRRLDLRLEPELPYVTARPEAVRQILDVLLANARDHGDGTVTVTGTRVGNGGVIAVHDQGTATLDPTVIFGRRNPDATGTGIGLALARRLAETENLRLVLADPGPQPTFHLIFPGATR